MDDRLKLTKPRMHGPAVKRLQETLERIGVDSVKVDGIFGPETESAVKHYQRLLGVDADGVVDSVLWGQLNVPPEEFTGAEDFADISPLHEKPRLYAGERPFSMIHGVTLHQTGCEMPRDPLGWRRVNAHIGITREGGVVIINTLTDFIWHAQGLSKKTIGIEVEGNYRGLIADPKTLWKGGGGPHNLNPAMTAAAARLFEYLKNEFRSHDVRWSYVFAHRQSAKSRIADPGEEIWQAIGMAWINKLVGSDGSDGYSLGSGRPIPREWNGTSTVGYWCAKGGTR
jgi:hypothetical protein